MWVLFVSLFFSGMISHGLAPRIQEAYHLPYLATLVQSWLFCDDFANGPSQLSMSPSQADLPQSNSLVWFWFCVLFVLFFSVAPRSGLRTA